LENLSESGIADGLAVLREAGAKAGRQPAELDGFRIVVRVTGTDHKLDMLASRLDSLASAGATELVVDVDWNDGDGPSRGFDTLRSAVA
jgi:hypothetical protein